MIFEYVSHINNFLLLPTEDGFATHSDFVFKYEGDGARRRYVVPAGWNVGRKAKRRRVRAHVVREYLRFKKAPRIEIARAYIAALRADGGKVLIHDQIGLMILKALS